MTSALRALERARSNYGPGWAARKAKLLRALARTALRTAGEVERLHELLAFMRAYPDDAPTLATVERMLRRFAARTDFVRHRDALADSGIRGTVTRYPLFWPTARWLARRAPASLAYDRDDAAAGDNLAAALPALVSPPERAWLAERAPAGFDAIDRLRGRASDAVYVLAAIDALPGDGFAREAFHDRIDATYRLAPGPGTPERTLARHARSPVVFQSSAPEHRRPPLAESVARAPARIRDAARAEAVDLIDLARGAMVSRSRDLDTFAYASPAAVFVTDDGDGLQYAFYGIVSERRTLFPALYGFLTLRNGVPIGYGQVDVLGASAAVSFNTFPTFRGAEAGHTFARLLAATHHALGATSFSLEPYQLGDHNEEGIASGAWWFYYKFGFRPVQPDAVRVMRSEVARMRRDAAHRSSRATLEALAKAHVFWHFDPARAVGLPRLAGLGETTVARIAADVDVDGTRPDPFDPAFLRVFGARTPRGWTAAEREAWTRWAPMLAAIPGFGRWSPRDRAALVPLIRAKGGRDERAFLRSFARHPRLGAAVFGTPSR